jgi:hypothetical protein
VSLFPRFVRFPSRRCLSHFASVASPSHLCASAYHSSSQGLFPSTLLPVTPVKSETHRIKCLVVVSSREGRHELRPRMRWSIKAQSREKWVNCSRSTLCQRSIELMDQSRGTLWRKEGGGYSIREQQRKERGETKKKKIIESNNEKGSSLEQNLREPNSLILKQKIHKESVSSGTSQQ